MIKNTIIEVAGRRWKVREAKTREDALSAIDMARVSGSVGWKDTIDRTYTGGVKEVLADVVQVNSDDTEVKPYSTAY